MHVFLANLTAALIAVHSVLGCCWHHTHRCTEQCATSQAMVVSGVCDQASHAESASDSHSHHGRHECQSAACVFMTAPNRGVCDTAISPAVTPIAYVPLAIATRRCPVDGQRFFPPDSLLPPLRVHLVCHVLLI